MDARELIRRSRIDTDIAIKALRQDPPNVALALESLPIAYDNQAAAHAKIAKADADLATAAYALATSVAAVRGHITG